MLKIQSSINPEKKMFGILKLDTSTDFKQWNSFQMMSRLVENNMGHTREYGNQNTIFRNLKTWYLC
jgi:hypothetical protein